MSWVALDLFNLFELCLLQFLDQLGCAEGSFALAIDHRRIQPVRKDLLCNPLLIGNDQAQLAFCDTNPFRKNLVSFLRWKILQCWTEHDVKLLVAEWQFAN